MVDEDEEDAFVRSVSRLMPKTAASEFSLLESVSLSVVAAGVAADAFIADIAFLPTLDTRSASDAIDSLPRDMTCESESELSEFVIIDEPEDEGDDDDDDGAEIEIVMVDAVDEVTDEPDEAIVVAVVDDDDDDDAGLSSRNSCTVGAGGRRDVERY